MTTSAAKRRPKLGAAWRPICWYFAWRYVTKNDGAALVLSRALLKPTFFRQYNNDPLAHSAPAKFPRGLDKSLSHMAVRPAPRAPRLETC